MSEETQQDPRPGETPAAPDETAAPQQTGEPEQPGAGVVEPSPAEQPAPDKPTEPEAKPPADESPAADARNDHSSPLPAPEDRLALLEAVIFVAEEPLPLKQIVAGLGWPREIVDEDLKALIASYASSTHGIEIRNVAGGYRMYTKAERHDEVKDFVKTLRPKLKLSMPALETLAVIAYKQPVTVPEIQAIRGVNAAGVINTLLQRKLIAPAGRKKVIGKPMMYKTTKEFLVQFGLSGVDELPSLKELEELSKAAFGEGEEPELEQSPESAAPGDLAEAVDSDDREQDSAMAEQLEPDVDEGAPADSDPAQESTAESAQPDVEALEQPGDDAEQQPSEKEPRDKKPSEG